MDAYQHHGWRENDTCGTLTAGQNDSIRGDTPLVCVPYTREIGRTLDTFVGSPECNQGGMVVVKSIDCRNIALNHELSGTLQAKENGGQSLNYQNPVVYSARCVGNGQLHQISMAEQANCLDCMHDQQAVIYPGVGITSLQNASNPQPGDPTPTLSTDSRNYLVKNSNPPRRYIVRRLTPLECCRLQGFPDWWEEGVEGSDSARYKMWGNGMALPNMLHVMRGIAMAEQWAGRCSE